MMCHANCVRYYINLVKMSSLSKSLYQLSVLCVFLVDLVICQNQWGCTAPDHNGQRYIPSERDRDAITSTTEGSSAIYIYRVSNLDASCYGPVTAIEYCYKYRTNVGSGQPLFNWTVLILEDTGSDFMINSIYFIASRLPVSSANCTASGQVITCCDRNNIEGFDLPTSNFAFGVTESTQGNTHEATLLGFSDSLPQYRVDVLLLTRAEVTLSIGSTIRNRPTVMRGICMLWFVIGVSPTEAPPRTTITSTSPVSSMAATDSRSTITIDTDSPTSIAATSPLSITTNAATSPVSTTIIILTATSPASIGTNAATVSGALLGGVTGSLSLLLLMALLLLLLALVWITKRYKINKAGKNEAQCNLDHQKPKKSEQRETEQQQQRQDDEAIEMKSSDAYMLTAQQIQTEDNVAYGQATPQIPIMDNVAYGQAAAQIPTEDNNYYCQIESDDHSHQWQCEYEYIS